MSIWSCGKKSGSPCCRIPCKTCIGDNKTINKTSCLKAAGECSCLLFAIAVISVWKTLILSLKMKTSYPCHVTSRRSKCERIVTSTRSCTQGSQVSAKFPTLLLHLKKSWNYPKTFRRKGKSEPHLSSISQLLHGKWVSLSFCLKILAALDCVWTTLK